MKLMLFLKNWKEQTRLRISLKIKKFQKDQSTIIDQSQELQIQTSVPIEDH